MTPIVIEKLKATIQIKIGDNSNFAFFWIYLKYQLGNIQWQQPRIHSLYAALYPNCYILGKKSSISPKISAANINKRIMISNVIGNSILNVI